MSNHEISSLLTEVAAAYSIKDEKKFRFQIIAYQKAAEAIAASTREISDLLAENKLEDFPGIGPSLRGHLEELIRSGHVKHFDSVLKEIPSAVFPLLKVPTFGPKKAYKLVSHFHLENSDTVLKDIKKLAETNQIAGLSGFGEKSQADILRAIDEYNLGKLKTTRMALPFAAELAQQVIAYLKKSPVIVEAETLGSLRRRRDTIGDVDIAVATNDTEKAIDYFIKYPYTDRVIEKGDRGASIVTTAGKQVDLLTQSPQGFGSLLQHFTGSKNHNVHLREYALRRGLSLSEYGIRKTTDKSLTEYKTEEDFYKALELDWIPPEIREDTGEIELAAKHNLPKLLELSDIKGDFHLHSSFPIEPSHDAGADSMETMVRKAISLGYAYLGFSEHNPSTSKHTAKETFAIMQKRNKEIERLRTKYIKDIHIFSLLEIDIMPNGSLALDEESLNLLDGAIVSIHSVFSMSKKDMTKRIIKGLSHPKAKILAHPSGRLINERAGYEVEWEELFAFCKDNNKALEINAWPQRLDLTDILVRQAKENDILMAIDTDSHQVSQMDMMQYGVSVARRGWATKRDILNAMEYNNLKAWFAKP